MRKTIEQFLADVKPFLDSYTVKDASEDNGWDAPDSPVLKWRIKGYRFLGRGRGRMTFRMPDKNWVLKIPYNLYGVEDNAREAKIYKDRKGICFPENPRGKRGRLAKCKLVVYSGISCVQMEFLTRTECWETDEYPDWVNGLVDGEQVGYDSKGRLAVFDYGLESYEDLKSYGYDHY